MKYIDEFRNKKLINTISKKIFEIMPSSKVRIMEVCGTHTQSFHRFGLKRLIPDNLYLIAGPGCPVCVCDQDYIDKAIELSKNKNTIILTFGDMLRVPGTNTSLEEQRAEGSDVRVVYSAWDSLSIAKENSKKTVIFLAVGFETTAPTFALTLQKARGEGLKNLFLFSALKLIPPAMKALLSDRKINLDGFLCPGHVSTIIGSQAYYFITKKYRIPCCIAGFEPLDILEGIYLLLCQIVKDKPTVVNQYARAVRKEGNKKAKAIINKVFKIRGDTWRGLGYIPASGLKIRDEFSRFDITEFGPLKSRLDSPEKMRPKRGNKNLKACSCQDVLKGIIQPDRCPLFRRVCSPTTPFGPCMVSNEGACNVFYKYQK